MRRAVEDDWSHWAMARCAIAFALEEEVREAATGGDLLWSLDADGALESLERLGDALAAALREVAERPPPAIVRPFRDALVRYLGWRTDFNDRMVRAAEIDGWPGARAVYEAEVAAGLPLFHAFQEELAALRGRRG